MSLGSPLLFRVQTRAPFRDLPLLLLLAALVRFFLGSLLRFLRVHQAASLLLLLLTPEHALLDLLFQSLSSMLVEQPLLLSFQSLAFRLQSLPFGADLLLFRLVPPRILGDQPQRQSHQQHGHQRQHRAKNAARARGRQGGEPCLPKRAEGLPG
jgi:hypothetical protein